MKLRLSIILVAVCLLLTGCSSWMDGAYHWKEPHLDRGNQQQGEIVITNFSQLCRALEDMVAAAADSSTFSVESYDTDRLESNLELAKRHIIGSDPLGAFAVEDIDYEIGTTGGGLAVAVEITYNYNRSVLRKIRYVSDMEQARSLVETALDSHQASLLMHVDRYEPTDYVQLVKDHAENNPFHVMEVPQIIVGEYPEGGGSRVVELQFTYQTNRETLRNMQAYVMPVLASASLYVSGEEDQAKKYEQLYSFLMERNDYSVETSMTPTYSLLRHGVGDSRAFAMVYAAMCRRAGLDCQMVAGTRDGEPWYWNIIQLEENYYHVDLLSAHTQGSYTRFYDTDMTGYVWDYSAYPACVPKEQEE